MVKWQRGIMKIDVISEKTNPYMKRKEMNARIEHSKESSPSKAAVQAIVAKQLKVDVERVEIVNIQSEVGMPASQSRIYVWQEKKVKDLSKNEEKKAEESKEEMIGKERKI